MRAETEAAVARPRRSCASTHPTGSTRATPVASSAHTQHDATHSPSVAPRRRGRPPRGRAASPSAVGRPSRSPSRSVTRRRGGPPTAARARPRAPRGRRTPLGAHRRQVRQVEEVVGEPRGLDLVETDVGQHRQHDVLGLERAGGDLAVTLLEGGVHDDAYASGSAPQTSSHPGDSSHAHAPSVVKTGPRSSASGSPYAADHASCPGWWRAAVVQISDARACIPGRPARRRVAALSCAHSRTTATQRHPDIHGCRTDRAPTAFEVGNGSR